MREIRGIWGRVVKALLIGLTAFHLWTGVFGLLSTLEQRAMHVGLALILVLALHDGRKTSGTKSSIPWWDLILIVLVLVSIGNIFVNWRQYMPMMASPATPFELALAVAAILVILESGRRVIGWAFPILTALILAYALWGQHIPGQFGHPPIGINMILRYVYFSTDGIWGFLTGLSATYIALFIAFGAILLTTGAGKTFIDLAMLATGKFRGGPAKVAVIGSGFFAMLSGSALANVATTGNFTIPMMKKLGYSPEFAGGVESVASTGGIVTPPIMGAAAFIMAEFLGIPYLKVVIAAAIPSFLFYVAVFMGVHFQAVKLNLVPIPRQDLPPVRSVFTGRRMLGLILPIAALLYTLLSGYSLILVATSACLIALATYIFSSPSFHEVKERLCNIPQTLEAAARALITIVPMLVCANIVLSLLSVTGLAIKFSQVVIGLGETHLFLSLLLTGVLVMILGTGLPVTAAYILGVVVAAPLLIGWGITPIAAHLFILYYSVLAIITPPVCPGVYLGAHIAGADWLKTAWVALKLAPLLYVMPFLFVFDNSFLMIGSPWSIALNVGTATAGTVLLASGIMGYLITKCRIIERLTLIASATLLLLPTWQADLLGIALFVAVLAIQLWLKKKGARVKVS